MEYASLYKKGAIVGVHEYPERNILGKTMFQVQAECIQAALDDAGLSMKDIDGLCVTPTSGFPPILFGEYLGIYPTFMDSTQIGGSSFVLYLIRALEAIALGRAKVVAIAYASLKVAQTKGSTAGKPVPGGPGDDYAANNYETPSGLTLIGTYALSAQRHMYQYGTKPEQLAEVGVAARRHASLNPNAKYRDPITIDDVLASRMICDPLHLLDCCLNSDGGGAVIVAHPDLAKDCMTKPVWALGAAEAGMHTSNGHRDFTVSAAAQSGPLAFKSAGVSPKDVDFGMFYDAFSINVIMTLEDLGFCNKGDGGAFVENGRISLEGDLPINTDGGGLSSCHPGMRGIFLLIEAARQLRGDFDGTPRQVPDAGIACVHGIGGYMGTRHSGVTALLTSH